MSNFIRLKYISEDALNDLKSEYDTYKTHYQDKTNDWFIKHLNSKEGLLDSNIECENFINKINMNPDYSISDFENIKVIYSALKDINPYIATDERLWAGLAHSQLWDFIKYRRQNEIASKKDEDIKNSFFFRRGKKRSLFINCLSRLWWTGYLTYDENAVDPYHLTKLLCKDAYASRILLLSSNNFISNRTITKGYLLSIEEREKSGEKLTRNHFVISARYLNNLGSATLLDMLDEHDIKEIIDEVLNNKFGVITKSI